MTTIDIWVVYDKPKDFPEDFVARLWKNHSATSTFHKAKSLEELRNLLPSGLACIARNETDDPCIVECWL